MTTIRVACQQLAPVVGELESNRAAALAGLRFAGFDVVEVAPAYDGPGQQTALLAAAIAYELLALRAIAERPA